MMQKPQMNQVDVEPLEEIEGEVERIVFESPETGFLVGRMLAAGRGVVTFVGNLMAISVGETLRMRGRWIEDKKFGRQMRVETFETILPSTLNGIEHYLGSGVIPGVGPSYAKRLVEAFGIETLRVLQEQPERLQSVPGIGRKRAHKIKDAWATQRQVQSIMIFLQGHGITMGQAAKIVKAYGQTALAVLRENPYRLAQDISGIGFGGADKIAAQLGIAPDSPFRLQAALLHVLRQASGEGHVFLPAADLLAHAGELVGAPHEKLVEAIEASRANKQIITEGDAAYLPWLYQAETDTANLLKKLLGTPHDAPAVKVEKALAWVEKKNDIALSPEQREAIRQGVEAKVLVITGGPGTGKTTVINSLLAILEAKAVSFLLAAPTGRAAKRMESATGREARTLHRLLEFSPQQGGFMRGEFNPLTTDLIVVDEASMLDQQLFHSLLQAVPPFARLVLVGDIDQLPSVGAGNVLFDVIGSGLVPVVRLKTVFRQGAESGIIFNAHLINQGRYPQFNQHDFFFIERKEPEEAVATIVELVKERMPAKFGLDPLHDVQVLAPLRRGDGGVNNLNEALQQALNPGGVLVPRRSMRVGDKVMQLKNNYDLDVYNGDVGIIKLVDEELSEVEVVFEERAVRYDYEELDNLGLAYASTIHKSQGSEYPAVVLCLLSRHFMMLQRNVLYTAITRGKKLVVIVGDPKAVGRAVHNTHVARRNTRLNERLRNVGGYP